LADDDGDGESWETAFNTLEAAEPSDGQTVYLRQGELTPPATDPYWLAEGARLVGGQPHELVGTTVQESAVDSSLWTRIGRERPEGDHDHGILRMRSRTVLQIISGEGGYSRVGGGGIRLWGADDVLLENVRVAGNGILGYIGNYGGGISCSSSTVVMNNVIITQNSAYGSEYYGRVGGGGLSAGECVLTLTDVEVSNNQAGTGSGAGLYLADSTVDMNRVVVRDNSASGGRTESEWGWGTVVGGGIYARNVTSNLPWSDLLIENNTVTGLPDYQFPYNTEYGGGASGAGLYTSQPIELINSVVVNNTAVVDGESTYVASGGGVFGPVVVLDYDPTNWTGNVPTAMEPCPDGWTGDNCDIVVGP
jgi:hypothetical protein